MIKEPGVAPDAPVERAAPEWFTSALQSCPVMGVFRGASPNDTVELSNRAWDMGILKVEVPIESRDAVPSLRAAIAAGAARGMRVGAGTIVTTERLRIAIGEGAGYAVSPGLDPHLIAIADEEMLPFIPGVATASEILQARRLGFEWIKAFPASILGAGWFSAMRGPFPDIKFVATGGMGGSTVTEYLSAGASVVGVGRSIREAGEAKLIRDLIAKESEAREARDKTPAD